MENTILKVENISKRYKLGQIGGTTLKEELQRLHARIRHKEDPTRMIGSAEIVPGTEFLALDGVSFDVKNGERVGIIGHNGAGKSTLLKLISRVTAPTKGDIWMNGRVASMLEVGTGFHGELTGRENIYMNGAILGMRKKEIDQKIESIIEFSECRQFIDTPVKRYSSGMYVKLAFSVAAHLDSEIMVMDEVLAVGDMAFQKKCLDKMSDVSREEGRTILYVSHNMGTIRQLCDRSIVLDHGKVIYDGDVETGIGLYMGSGENDECPTFYDFSNVSRQYQFGKQIFVESFRFLDCNSAEFRTGSKIVVEIILKSLIQRDNVSLVMRIKDKQGVEKRASSLSDGFTVREGEHQVFHFLLDTTPLMADMYSLSFEVIQYNEDGYYFSYDNPGAMMPVRITNRGTRDSWSKKYWGNIRMENMKVLDNWKTY